MFSGKFSWRTCGIPSVLMALAIVVFAAPAFAQTGRIQGKVADEAGKPVDGAKIVVSSIPDTRTATTSSGPCPSRGSISSGLKKAVWASMKPARRCAWGISRR